MKKILLILFAISIVLVGCGDKETKVASGNEAEEQPKINYGEELSGLVLEVVSNTSIAEEMTNVYAYLWSNTIEYNGWFPIREIANILGTDKDLLNDYFGNDGTSPNYFRGDFNEAILQLGRYYVQHGKVDDLNEGSDKIESKIKELNNPPEEYEKVYDEIIELYTMEEEYVQMAISPSGSLISFNESRNTLSTNIVSKVKEIDVIMPSKEDKE